MNESNRRIGIFGGSFDPIHFGHLLLAENCREQAGLSEVWFVPAAMSPHKRNQDMADATARCDMLELAIAGHPAFRLSRIELDRGGVSYSVTTLESIAQSNPTSELFFLLGADALAELPTWYEPKRICELATPLVVRRYDAPQPDWNRLADQLSADVVDRMRRHEVSMPRIEISSSDMRKRVSKSLSIRFQTPRAVEMYIETHGLYQ